MGNLLSDASHRRSELSLHHLGIEMQDPIPSPTEPPISACISGAPLGVILAIHLAGSSPLLRGLPKIVSSS
jgi:hypothetical protein